MATDPATSRRRRREAPATQAVGPEMRATLQRQARALGDPTRFEIFRFVAESTAPVRIATLGARFPFSPSAIRQHLAKLCDARLLVEGRTSGSGAGRPPLEYRLAPTALGPWASPGPYEFLAMRLLDVARGASPVEAGVSGGRELAMAHGADEDPVDVIEVEMARRGFEPRREEHPRSVELILERCPFEAAATADPNIVCEIHRGLVEGILDATDAEVTVSKLIAYNPRRAGCRLQMKRSAPHAPTRSADPVAN